MLYVSPIHSQMRQPFLLQFRDLISQGAGVQDIHDARRESGYTSTTQKSREHFLAREIERVKVHQNATCALLEHFIGRAPRILDVGCGTGATTVALALSKKLDPGKVIGVDASELTVEAARVRAAGHDLCARQIEFEHVQAGTRLPFADNSFDLVVSVSVLEFISNVAGRKFLASEMYRVTRPRGHIFVSTPAKYRWREFHSAKVLGNFVHRDGFPWSSSGRAIRRMFWPAQSLRVASYRLGPFAGQLSPAIAPFAGALFPWQKHLFKK